MLLALPYMEAVILVVSILALLTFYEFRPDWKPYNYQESLPIDPKLQVRLLRRIKKGKGSVKYRLVAVPVEELPQTTYTALSYMWQPASLDPYKTHTLYIDTSQENQFTVPFRHWHTLKITDNLHRFIKESERCTSHVLSDLIFIDALCINQEDQKEKADQVLLMGHIYSNAKKTIVWLGGNTHELKSTKNREYYIPKSVVRDREIFCQEYWERVWIVQECLLSGNTYIWFGGKSFAWETMDRVIQVADVGNNMAHPLEQRARSVFDAKRKFSASLQRQAVQDRSPGLTMQESIYHFGRQKCSNAKDKVYGSLAITRHNNITVSYNARWKFQQVMEEMMEEVCTEIFDTSDALLQEKWKEYDKFLSFLSNDFCLNSGADKASVMSAASKTTSHLERIWSNHLTGRRY